MSVGGSVCLCLCLCVSVCTIGCVSTQLHGVTLDSYPLIHGPAPFKDRWKPTSTMRSRPTSSAASSRLISRQAKRQRRIGRSLHHIFLILMSLFSPPPQKKYSAVLLVQSFQPLVVMEKVNHLVAPAEGENRLGRFCGCLLLLFVVVVVGCGLCVGVDDVVVV